MAMIPSNSDFGRKGFSNVTQTQITDVIGLVTADGWTDQFPTLTSDTIETQTEWHTLSTWTWNFSKAINRCSVKRFAITKATKIICSVSSTFLNIFFNQVCKLCVMCACVVCVNSKRQHPKIRVHCARIRDADWSAKGMLRY